MDDRKLPEANKYYSATAVMKEGFLGDWKKSRKSFTDYLRTERGQEVFKPIIKQNKKNETFKIKGQMILDVIDMIEQGTLRL